MRHSRQNKNHDRSVFVHLAYSSTDALCVRLNQVAWKWHVGDSHWYGDYVVTRSLPGVRIRIVDFPKHTETGYQYDSDIRIGKECTTPMSEIDAAYRNILAISQHMTSGKLSGSIEMIRLYAISGGGK